MTVVLVFKRLLDFVLVSIVITPSTVSFWRGTWYILDLVVFSCYEFDGACAWTTPVSFIASFIVIYLFLLAENYIRAFLNERNAKNLWYLVMIYLLAFVAVTSWRGLWLLLDHYTTTSLISGFVTHAVGFFVVLSMKATSSVIAPPGYCKERNADPSTNIIAMKNCLTMSCWTTRINSFFTVFVIGSAVICYWRGTWIIVKSVTQVDDNRISCIIAIGMGYAIWSICCIFSESVGTKKLDPPYHHGWRVLEGAFVYVLGLGVVATWVGIWSLEDVYLFPDKQIASALICHFLGVALLFLLQASMNLIGSPVGCRNNSDNKLEGLDMGSYLKTQTEKGDVGQNLITSNKSSAMPE